MYPVNLSTRKNKQRKPVRGSLLTKNSKGQPSLLHIIINKGKCLLAHYLWGGG